MTQEKTEHAGAPLLFDQRGDVAKRSSHRRRRSCPLNSIVAGKNLTADIEATGEDICELRLGCKEDKMAGTDCNKVESSVGSSQDKRSKNKRKLADHFQLNPVSLSSSLTEFPQNEQISKKTQNPLSNLQSLKEESSQSEKDPIEEYQSSEWDDPYVRSLEELLSASLQTLFKGAIKRIVEYDL
ncbi:hypothetical protein LWI28_003187 [Acer negundo]|uniref:Uncharacterized protein n=1 Tax=Acer negundo TaxID=4023 RepID=A0AAD5J2N3_ACENE|nr:hypothetical protein LWI28_003187 [Acer negundo]